MQSWSGVGNQTTATVSPSVVAWPSYVVYRSFHVSTCGLSVDVPRECLLCWRRKCGSFESPPLMVRPAKSHGEGHSSVVGSGHHISFLHSVNRVVGFGDWAVRDIPLAGAQKYLHIVTWHFRKKYNYVPSRFDGHNQVLLFRIIIS